MKKIIQFTLILFLFVASGTMQAQEVQKEKGKRGHHREQLRTELGLTDAQADQMEAVREKYQPQVKAVWADETLDDAAKHAKMRSIRDAKQAEVKTILTAEQLTKLEASHQAHRGGHGSQGSKGEFKGHHGQGGHGHMGEFHRKGQKGGIHAELQPIMLRQRAKLESQLSVQDKAELEGLRTRMAESKVQNQAFHKEMRELRKTDAKPTEAQMAQKKAMHEANRAMKAEVLTIAQRYDAQIKALHEEVKPEVEAIMAKHEGKCEGKGNGNQGADGKQDKCEKGGSKCEKGGEGKCEKGGAKCEGKGGRPPGGHGPHQGDQAGRHHDGMLVHFMLLDPNATGQSAESRVGNRKGKTMKVFPNPSSGSNTLEYELEKAANVKVELLAINGQVLRVLDEGQKDAGTQELKVNLLDLAAGIYFYRISGDIETQQRRFSVTE